MRFKASELGMTEKQKECINWICELLEIDYTGEDTKKDAWQFIHDNIDTAKQLQEEVNKENAYESWLYKRCNFGIIEELTNCCDCDW